MLLLHFSLEGSFPSLHFSTILQRNTPVQRYTPRPRPSSRSSCPSSDLLDAMGRVIKRVKNWFPLCSGIWSWLSVVGGRGGACRVDYARQFSRKSREGVGQIETATRSSRVTLPRCWPVFSPGLNIICRAWNNDPSGRDEGTRRRRRVN